MKYYLYIEGSGNGCDCPVSCNEALVELKSDNYTDSINECHDYLMQFSGDEYEGLFRKGKATLIQSENQLELDVRGWFQEEEKARNERVKRRSEEKRKAEYEKLKREFDP